MSAIYTRLKAPIFLSQFWRKTFLAISEKNPHSDEKDHSLPICDNVIPDVHWVHFSIWVSVYPGI